MRFIGKHLQEKVRDEIFEVQLEPLFAAKFLIYIDALLHASIHLKVLNGLISSLGAFVLLN